MYKVFFNVADPTSKLNKWEERKTFKTENGAVEFCQKILSEIDPLATVVFEPNGAIEMGFWGFKDCGYWHLMIALV